ncbi:MAG: MBOAT family protein [Flavobacteriales bacterium]|nr:MBOAT family protein [Flavobacteriales bacterium]
MLFNSIDFAVFLPLVFLLYWAVGGRSLARRNAIILGASYVFYGWWDWRFMGLLALSTLVDFAVGIGMDRSGTLRRRRWLLALSLVVNLGLLGFFKYFNFFAQSFADAFTIFGVPFTADRLDLVLPVGISFYTFQTLSYSIDVYRGHLRASRDAVAFAAYVSFFPQLVAGPIERAVNLLPQFASPRVFDRAKAVDGLRQMLWGLFKKLVIADNCAPHVQAIFADHEAWNASTVLVGAFLFGIQVYCDFSGYSDIAIGCARLFGFDLMRNFAFPLFARDIAEYWRRWNISVTTWFRDYVYVPLGGSRGRLPQRIRNTLLVFMVSGFWHGPNWTFVAWGLLHGLYFMPQLLLGTNRQFLDSVAQGRLLPRVGEVLLMLRTTLLTCIGHIFFLGTDMRDVMATLTHLVDPSILSRPQIDASALWLMLVLFFAVEWVGREHQFAIERLGLRWRRPLRWSAYASLCFVIIMYMRTDEVPFFYFQF